MKKTLLWLFLLFVGVAALTAVLWDEHVVAQEFGDTDFDEELEEDVEIEVDEHTDIEEPEEEEEDESSEDEDASEKQPNKK